MRIIPAYAGLTRSYRHRAPESADHPRLRGVNRLELRAESFRRGSSPLTRG